MIVLRGPSVWRMVRYVGSPLIALLAWDVVIVVAYMGFHLTWVGSRHIPLALYGGAIGVIIGFRNNSSYARWWEARTLWGAIVNNSRSVGRLVVSALHTSVPEEIPAVETLKRDLIYHQIAWVHALRMQLRGLAPWQVLTPLLGSAEIDLLRDQKNVPLLLQSRMSDMLGRARRSGWLKNLDLHSINGNIDDLTDAQGGAERIKSTPLPKQYDYFPMLFVQIYCLLLPIGLVETLGWFTPLGSTLVGFMFLTLDRIGRDLENPFENTVYDVSLTAIATTIEINLRQLLGESNLPEPITPVDGVLW